MTDDTDTPTDEPSDNQIQSLERRVAELEAMTEVDSEDGGGLSLPDLLDLGLTRRQALMAIALVGAGYALGPAITKSISEPAAASHGGATLGTADNPLSEIYVEDLYNTTDNIAADSVSTDELNSTVWTDPDESDFATALNDALTRVADGGAVIVAPVAYSWDGTTVSLPDKDVRITAPGTEQKGGGGGGGDTDSLYPLVDLGSTDGTVIQVPRNSQNQTTIAGLTFEGDDSQTANLIEAHAPIAASGISATDIGTATLIALVTNAGENVNISKIIGVGARQAGRVVSIEDPGNTANTNSVKVTIDSAFNMTDCAIYTEGNSGVLEVNQFEGGTSPTAGIDVQGQRNYATVWRNETSAPAIRFGDAANFAEVLYDQSGAGIQYDNSNNRAINYATDASWAELLAGSGGWRVHNVLRMADDAPIRLQDENGDLVELRADGGDLIVEDANGDTTTLS